jgi:hypothetical protein
MNSSARSGSLVVQGMNFLDTEESISSPPFFCPERASSSTSMASLRAFCISLIRRSHSFPRSGLASNHSLRPSSTTERTIPSTGALFSRSFVCPWNCGLGSLMDTTATSPCWITSALKLCLSRSRMTPLRSAWSFSTRVSAALNPVSCTPPSRVRTPLAKL